MDNKRKLFVLLLDILNVLTLLEPVIVDIIGYIGFASKNYEEFVYLDSNLTIRRIAVQVGVNVTQLDLKKCTDQAYKEYELLRESIVSVSVQIWISILVSMALTIYKKYAKYIWEPQSILKKILAWILRGLLKVLIFPGISLFKVVELNDCIYLDTFWFPAASDDFIYMQYFITINNLFFFSHIPLMLIVLLDCLLCRPKVNVSRRNIWQILGFVGIFLTTIPSIFFGFLLISFSGLIYLKSFIPVWLESLLFTSNLTIDLTSSLIDIPSSVVVPE